ncbi:hypothetical protein RJ640_024802, partial [Escallonia rubra]
MGVIRSSFTFMVGAISRAYIAPNYHVPNIRKHYKRVEKEADKDMVTLSRIKSKDPSQRPFH